MPACHGMRKDAAGDFQQCTSTDLIRAHIFPQSVARFVREESQHNLQITDEWVGKAQLGEYDPTILCWPCDNRLGDYDEYAIELFRTFPEKHRVIGGDWFEVPDVDGDQLSKFFLAVLWRAAISSRRVFASVDLGPFEPMVRKVLFDAAPLSDLPAYALILSRLKSDSIPTRRFYTSPARSRFPAFNGYSFAVGGFRVTAKLDSRPLPPLWAPIVVRDRRALRGPLVDFEETTEWEFLRDVARRHGPRRR